MLIPIAMSNPAPRIARTIGVMSPVVVAAGMMFGGPDGATDGSVAVPSGEGPCERPGASLWLGSGVAPARLGLGAAGDAPSRRVADGRGVGGGLLVAAGGLEVGVPKENTALVVVVLAGMLAIVHVAPCPAHAPVQPEK
jgi:hypothetical protein